MKKKIALAMASIMVFAAAVPMNLFAATSNIGSSVSGYEADTLIPDAELGIASGKVKITDFKEKSSGSVGTNLILTLRDNVSSKSSESFTVELTGAEWAFFGNDDGDTTSSAAVIKDESTGKFSNTTWGKKYVAISSLPDTTGRITNLFYKGSTTVTSLTGIAGVGAENTDLSAAKEIPFEIEVNPSQKSFATIRFNSGTTGLTKDSNIKIPVVMMAKGEGAISAQIVSNTTSVSSGTVDFSTSGKGITLVKPNVAEGLKEIALKDIILRELSKGSWKDGSFELQAPSGYEFDRVAGGTGTVVFRNFVAGSANPINYADADMGGGTAVAGDSGAVAYTADLFMKTSSGTGSENYDPSRLKVTLPKSVIAITDKTCEIVFKGLKLVPVDTDSIDFNTELSLTLTEGAGVKSTTFTAAKFVKSAIKYTAETTVKSLYAGFVEFKDEYKTAKVTIKEEGSKSWWTIKDTEFTLTDADGKKLDGVKIAYVNVKLTNGDMASVSGGASFADGTEYKGLKNEAANNDKSGRNAWFSKDGATFTMTNVIPKNTSSTDTTPKKVTADITFYISPDINFEGDVYVKVGGRGIDVSDDYITNKGIVQIANVKPIVAVDTKTTSVQIGYLKFDVADINITELKKDSLKANKNINVSVGELGVLTTTYIKFNPITAANIAVEGDLKVSVVNTNVATPNIDIKIDRTSKTDGGTISLKNLKVTLDRNVPYGQYELNLNGTALRNNYTAYDSTGYYYDKFYNNGLIVEKFITVDTEGANVGLKNEVKLFNNGTASVLVNGAATEMESPVTNINGRLFVPVRSLTNSLGGTDKDIQFTSVPGQPTIVAVTLNGVTAVFTNGLGTYTKSTTGTTLWAMPENLPTQIINGRTYVPFRGFGEAFGINVSWDEATNSATFNGK